MNNLRKIIIDVAENMVKNLPITIVQMINNSSLYGAFNKEEDGDFIYINPDTIYLLAKELNVDVIKLTKAIVAHEIGHYCDKNIFVSSEILKEEKAYEFGWEYVDKEFENEYVMFNEMNLRNY